LFRVKRSGEWCAGVSGALEISSVTFAEADSLAVFCDKNVGLGNSLLNKREQELTVAYPS